MRIGQSAASLSVPLRDVAKALASWYRKNARDLPFRKTRDPYRIWISEVMLQQTRVAAMLPAYERFLKRFPDVDSLAIAEEAEVLRNWQGLGYYSRARNLHRAARTLQSHNPNPSRKRSVVPVAYHDLLSLPGVGPYTAAAVASIAADEPVAVVDGNVRRVLSRLMHPAAKRKGTRTTTGPGTKDLAVLADRFLREGSQPPSVHNQAVMELGALVCLPGMPLCEACPLTVFCGAYRSGGESFAATIPLSRKQQRIPLDLDVEVHWRPQEGEGEEFFLIPNSDGPFLKGHPFFPHRVREDGRETYRSPAFVSKDTQEQAVLFRHSIMDWRLRCSVHAVKHAPLPSRGSARRSRNASAGDWVKRADLNASLFSSLGVKIMQAFNRSQSAPPCV